MIAPAQDYQRSQHRLPPKPFKGADAAFNHLIGCYRRRPGVVKKLRREAEAVDALAPALVEMSDERLQECLMGLREVFRRGGKAVESQVLPALAAIREASERKLGMRPFLVQIMGALALHRGYLAEMATGEGKTLTAGLAAVLAGWTRRPCHIITVNDYLVERDARRLEPFYTFCGVSVGCITGAMDQSARLQGYSCDIAYATSKELLADFLRDRIRLGDLQNPTRRLIRHLLSPCPVGQTAVGAGGGLVLRGLHTAIIDEADSVLIDQAVTPLIISAPHQNEQLKEACQIAHAIIAQLRPGEDYEVLHRYKEIELTEHGREKLRDRAATLPGLWQGSERRIELVVQALVAREFFHRDKQYIVADDHVIIVDEFTGRPMPQRTWRQGMHQAIEAKEGIPISDPSETIARLSFQRFFRFFQKLSGTTGTAHETAGEFWDCYQLPVVQIPTNRPCIRKQWPDRVFSDETSKWAAVVEEIVRLHAQGRPILVGTRSVMASEYLAGLLSQKGLQCNVLNASRLSEEASIIAMAGEHARVTIATNMAGRGTDILLGRGIAALGGLHVIATERHESGRVDRQLLGRSSRQGDPGSAQRFMSLEDELMVRHLRAPLRKTLAGLLGGAIKGGARSPNSSTFPERLAGIGFWLAQQKAQSVAAKQRRKVLQTDLWLEDSLSFAGGTGL